MSLKNFLTQPTQQPSRYLKQKVVKIYTHKNRENWVGNPVYTCNSAASHVGILSANHLNQHEGKSFGGKIEDGADDKVQEQTTWNEKKIKLQNNV